MISKIYGTPRRRLGKNLVHCVSLNEVLDGLVGGGLADKVDDQLTLIAIVQI